MKKYMIKRREPKRGIPCYMVFFEGTNMCCFTSKKKGSIFTNKFGVDCVCARCKDDVKVVEV